VQVASSLFESALETVRGEVFRQDPELKAPTIEKIYRIQTGRIAIRRRHGKPGNGREFRSFATR